MVALNDVAPKPARPSIWRFDFRDPGRSFTLAFGDERWSLAAEDRQPDVVIDTTARAWADFVTQPPTRRRLPSREIEVTGDPDRVAELAGVFGGTGIEHD